MVEPGSVRIAGGPLRIAKATGLPLADPRAAVDDLARPPENHHRVAGNPGVRQLRGALRLSLDDEWEPGHRSASSDSSLRCALFSWLPTATRGERPVRGVDDVTHRLALAPRAEHSARPIVVTAECPNRA